MNTRNVLIALLATTVSACVVLAYLWIDRSISLSYARQSNETANSSVQRLQRLLEAEWQGMPKTQVLQKLEKASKQMPEAKVVVKQEDGAVWFDEVRFNFEQERLSSIGYP